MYCSAASAPALSLRFSVALLRGETCRCLKRGKHCCSQLAFQVAALLGPLQGKIVS